MAADDAQTLVGPNDTYRLDATIGGKGKYGGIRRATALSTGRKVSVKSLDKYGTALPELLRKLRDIHHNGIAPVVDIFVGNDGRLHVVRDFIDGIDLKSIFTDKPLYRRIDEHKFLDAGCAVLEALSAVHAAGIIHRDVKPSNIVIPLSEGQSPAEADFTQAVLIDFEQCAPFPDLSGVRSAFALVYSPPEMLLKYNSLVGPWSDLFALSVALFQLVMGKAPYTDCNPEILVNLQLTYPMHQPARMADDLFACLSRAAYKHPFRLPPRRLNQEEIEQTLRLGIQGRYQSADDMLRDLRNVREPFKHVNWFVRTFGE